MLSNAASLVSLAHLSSEIFALEVSCLFRIVRNDVAIESHLVFDQNVIESKNAYFSRKLEEKSFSTPCLSSR